MKNLTIKKIAFGLLLAGYASSSAFALQATTKQVINGNAPVISKTSSDVDHTVSVTITTDPDGAKPIGETDLVKVGHYVAISFNLKDPDGDVDNASIEKTLTIYYRKKKSDGTFDAWQTVGHGDLQDLKTTNTDNQDGVSLTKIVFRLNDQFKGAYEIGFKLQEQTEFGLPAVNEWLNVSDIWATTAPEHSKDEPTAPPASLVGPGDVPPGSKRPVVNDSVKLGIFKYDANDNLVTSVNYAKDDSNTPTPNYGEKFGAVVWTDDNDNDTVDNDEAIVTSSYEYEWLLAGNAYEGVDPKNDVIATGSTIFLGSKTANNNSIYDSTYKAGAQGYKLSVKTK